MQPFDTTMNSSHPVARDNFEYILGENLNTSEGKLV